MSDRLKELRERSQKRRQLLAQQVNVRGGKSFHGKDIGMFGVSNPDELGNVLSSKDEQREQVVHKPVASGSGLDTPPVKKRTTNDCTTIDTSTGYDPIKELNENREDDEDEEKEEIRDYTDSSAFLKGTQSANPHNDYCQHLVDSGERPQNFIRDVGLANRFEEYPKLRELIRLKDELIEKTNTPPMYLKCDLAAFDLRELDSEFDVILIEPPLEEYQRTLGVVKDKFWSWEEIEKLRIDQVAAQRSFLWIWCGSSDGLDAGRRCLKRWGFRRCEDICWIKTNIKNPGHNKNLEPKSVFQRTKEHCLMGIKGTVRRSVDGDFIHANVDIDLIIEEEKPYGSDEKPIELLHMIQHFCLGRRRLQLFGKDTTIRPGWLTIGPELTSSNFDPEVYNSYFQGGNGGIPNGVLTGCSDEIERLRPKSPTPKDKMMNRGRGGRGGERGGPGRGGPGRGGPGRGGPPRGGMRGGRGWGADRGRGGFRGRGGMRGAPR